MNVFKSLLSEKKFCKQFVLFAFFISIQSLVSLCLNLTDSIMITFYDEMAFVGVSLTNNFQYFFQIIIMAIGEGVLILVARNWGKEDLLSIQKICSISISISVLLGIIFNLVLFTFPEFLLSFFIKDSLVISQSIGYVKITSFTYTLFAASQIIIYVFRGVGQARIGWTTSFFALILNFLSNYVLIYGNLGFPKLGIEGAAIATLVARTAELGFVIFYVIKLKKLQIIKVLKSVDFNILKSYLKIFYPLLTSNILWGGFTFIQTYILGSFGTTVIAANSIAMTLYSMLAVTFCGFANATAVSVSQMIGKGQFNSLKERLKLFQFLFLINGILGSIVVFFSKEVISNFFKVSYEIKELSTNFILIMAVMAIFSAYQMPLLVGVIAGLGKVKYTLAIDLLIIWLVIVPISLFSNSFLHFSPLALFIILKSDQLIKCFIAFFKINFSFPNEKEYYEEL
ncbi:MAG: MATE family efflux transporter [Endomicrobium sp.]|jgi:putative MATE family efflux protein|nr:MATE family efflux transporter [Endomicrobium sp.]